MQHIKHENWRHNIENGTECKLKKGYLTTVGENCSNLEIDDEEIKELIHLNL